MEETFTITRGDLIDAFAQWHADCDKNADGTLAGVTPDDPAQQADVLLGYLKPDAV